MTYLYPQWELTALVMAAIPLYMTTITSTHVRWVGYLISQEHDAVISLTSQYSAHTLQAQHV